MALEPIRIRVVNWEKYNPGRNGKKMPWFKMDTGFIFDEKMIRMAPITKYVFVGLLCLCSHRGRDELDTNLASLSRQLGMKPGVTRHQLGMISENGLIQLNDNITQNFSCLDRQDKRRGEEIRGDKITSKPESKSGDLLVLLWNETRDLPKIKTVTTYHRKLAREAYQEQPSLEFWRDVFKKIQSSGFLTGQNKSGWRADFSWVLSKGNYGRIADGSFGENENSEEYWKKVFGENYVPIS